MDNKTTSQSRTLSGNVVERVNRGGKKKHKRINFWAIYILIVLIALVVIAISWVKTRQIMVEYEESQPENYVEKIIADLSKGDTSCLAQTNVSNKFENLGSTEEIFNSLVAGRTLGYKKVASANGAAYNLLAGDETIGKIDLVAKDHVIKLLFVDIVDWELEKVALSVKDGTNDIKVTVPESFTVTVNGVQLGEEEITVGPVQMEGFEYAAEYVAIPSVVTYEVKDLYAIPTVTVTDNLGNPVDMTGADLSDYIATFAVSEMPEDLKTHVLNVAIDYSNFFSRDLPGCYDSTACIQPYFPEGSYYIQMAEIYRQMDMWMFSKHETPIFSNETVTDYIRYSDDLFTVRVAFDKYMLLANGSERTDVNNQIYTYVAINGNWVIADVRDTQ